MTINGKKYRKGDYFGDVELSESELKFNKEHPDVTGLEFEPIKEVKSESEFMFKSLEEAKAKADELGLKYHFKAGQEKIEKLIKEHLG